MLEQLLPQIVALSKQAGQAIMDVYAEPVQAVLSKTDDSPLTQADLASDRIIHSGLLELDLGWPILSEETALVAYDERKSWSRFWLVDPLDGTKEFISRNGEFTVNIALIEDGSPVLGVVYAPALDVCYFSARGIGAFIQRGTTPAQRIRVQPFVRPIKVVASRSHADARTTELLDRLGVHEYISMGSSLKLCAVAEGVAHFYPRLAPTMEWDTAAAHAVVNEADGIVCDLTGAELRYNKPNLLNSEFLVMSGRYDMLHTFNALLSQDTSSTA